jgi:hypothetical protein
VCEAAQTTGDDGKVVAAESAARRSVDPIVVQPPKNYKLPPENLHYLSSLLSRAIRAFVGTYQLLALRSQPTPILAAETR